MVPEAIEYSDVQTEAQISSYLYRHESAQRHQSYEYNYRNQNQYPMYIETPEQDEILVEKSTPDAEKS